MRYLKIHTLKKGWCGKDEILLHATFQLLVDFVEQEKPGQIIDWEADELHKKSCHYTGGGKRSAHPEKPFGCTPASTTAAQQVLGTKPNNLRKSA